MCTPLTEPCATLRQPCTSLTQPCAPLWQPCEPPPSYVRPSPYNVMETCIQRSNVADTVDQGCLNGRPMVKFTVRTSARVRIYPCRCVFIYGWVFTVRADGKKMRMCGPDYASERTSSFPPPSPLPSPVPPRSPFLTDAARTLEKKDFILF
jgi:hypothetical protein